MQVGNAHYINEERKSYALYILQSRAIPHLADGMKHSSRRIMWTARNCKEWKSTTLAGATMPIHPHGDEPLQNSINTLAAYYGNNIPLLKGSGAFGTLLKPNSYGASRYTAVTPSQFAIDVLYRDIEIIPMVENYDNTEYEPKHFLPLVPLVLLNPQQGIAVGFACSILPRTLEDIIMSQLLYLQGKKVEDKLPGFEPTNSFCEQAYKDKNGNMRYVFYGHFNRTNATTIQIDNLPYGMLHEKLLEQLDKLQSEGLVQEYIDNSKNVYDITVRFKKGTLSKLEDEEVIKKLGLKTEMTENLTLIDFNGTRVLNCTYSDVIKQFTSWRLQWYKTRYERLQRLLEQDIQKYKDILTAIKKNVGNVAKKVNSKSELKEFLTQIGIVNVDFIADLPVYRFTQEEREKVEQKLQDAQETMNKYNTLLSDEGERKKVYVQELKQILKNHGKGHYSVI